MKKLLLLLCLTFVWVPRARADRKEKGWYPGVIVLLTGETVHGELHYDHHAEVVQCRAGEVTRAFNAVQVKYFRFQENPEATDRKFVPVLYNPYSTYERPSFFEVVSTGEVTVLRRHSSWRHLTGNPKFMQVKEGLGFSNNTLGFDYYVQSPQGVRKVKSFRKEFFPVIMKEYGEKVKQFARENHLRLFTQAGQIVVLNYYNYLKNPLTNRWEADNATLVAQPAAR